jgi:hypothetical protein
MEASNTEQNAYLKNRIEQLLSEILSDKHECRVVLKFGKSNEEKEIKQ